MKRNTVTIEADGTQTEGEPWDCDWEEIRDMRKGLIQILDGWYLKDRWDALSSTDKNAIRQTLRDLPQTYDNANEAFDNFPEAEEWMMKG